MCDMKSLFCKAIEGKLEFYAQPTLNAFIIAYIFIGFCLMMCQNRMKTNVQGFARSLHKRRKIN
jgi:hypothetical protein